MSFTTIAIEGGLLPNDLLDRLAAGDPGLPGQKPGDFGLKSARLADEIQSAYSDAQRHWAAFQSRYRQAAERGRVSITTVTRESWIEPILERLDYDLQFQRAGIEAGGQSFVISYLAGAEPSAPPVQGVGCDDDLDKRAEKRRSPHSTVQEYLNQSDAVWGIVTNGSKLRLLRHSTRIAKPRFVEFDLAGMMESNVYSEFALFYRLLHRTRLPRSSADAHECWLEKYYAEGVEQGGRVRDRLRDGVEEALKTFGSAFLKHPANNELRVAITDGRLTAASFYRELLRLVYRMLFLMVAEERRLMFPIDRANDPRQTIFTNYYGVNRLRKLADRYISPDPEIDLWESLKHSFEILRSDSHATKLGMAALNGELFGPHGCPNLETACLRNDDLLRAIRALATFEDDGTRRRVNFGALDVEELGSVYESLLDFHPEVSTNPAGFDLVIGSERKTTGSYYTPPELVHELIESALVPVMNERLEAANTQDEKIAAMLALRIVDPATGSGHFLLAAARRIGKELARIRSGEEEPAPPDYRHAVRDVIRECIYAVDKNRLAVDLCKVALWIEGHNAGQPLSFLDHHVKCGDSLVGVFDLKVLEDGLPDDAYKAVTGDDKDAAKFYRKRNKEERESRQMTLTPPAPPAEVVAGFEALGHLDEQTPADVEKKQTEYSKLREGREWIRRKNACDAWTAAFFVPFKMPEFSGQDTVPTSATVTAMLNGNQIHGKQVQEITKAATAYSFFHWPLEFPEVFARKGFDVVLGNPPWERIKLQEKEFFASRVPAITRTINKADREKLIKELPLRRPDIASEWSFAVHGADCSGKFVRESGRFPLCGRGDVNTYSIFAELARGLAGMDGRAGIIVPSGIAIDDTTKFFFRDLMESRSLASLYDFENRRKLFPAIDSRMKFCLLTMTGVSFAPAADFVFFAHSVEDLHSSDRRFTLGTREIAILNPNTRTTPVFRLPGDAILCLGISLRVPCLTLEPETRSDHWGFAYREVFHMSHDAHLFKTRASTESREGGLLESLPLYEAKMIHHFDHRWISFAGSDGDSGRQIQHDDPCSFALPRYWIPKAELSSRIRGWNRKWHIGWRSISNATNERTLIVTVIPQAGMSNSLPMAIVENPHAWALPSVMSSFVADFGARQRLGGTNVTMNILRQVPVLTPKQLEANVSWYDNLSFLKSFLLPRTLELTYTAWDLEPFGRDCGCLGAPYRWDEGRRFLIRCELDAAFFHLYLQCETSGYWLRADGETPEELRRLAANFPTPRDAAGYIMDSFSIVKRKDEERFGEYRTKRVILEIYDEMLRAQQTGKPYQTRLDPPPGDARAAHAGSRQLLKGEPLDAI